MPERADLVVPSMDPGRGATGSLLPVLRSERTKTLVEDYQWHPNGKVDPVHLLPPPTLSALVLARDEAVNLPACLDALAWADERIVVVDPASLDDTEAIAGRLADLVLVRPFDDFAAQRNAGLDAATGDWVFAVDADERATPGLAAEIRAAIGHPGGPTGFRVPIRSVILGRPFAHSGTQCDLPLRLFRRDRGRWVGRVHETVALDGPAGTLRSALRHETIPDMQTFLRKLDRYTSLEAAQMLDEGRPPCPSDLALRPAWTFLKLYLAKQGFRDGPEGFVFCALSGVSVGVRHWKHRELARSRWTQSVQASVPTQSVGTSDRENLRNDSFPRSAWERNPRRSASSDPNRSRRAS